MPNANTLIARGMFRGAKYTHHTFTPIIKHLITTTANKHPGKKSFIDKNMKNPIGIKLRISHKIKWPLPGDPPLKSYCPNKSNYKNYLQQIHGDCFQHARHVKQCVLILLKLCGANNPYIDHAQSQWFRTIAICIGCVRTLP